MIYTKAGIIVNSNKKSSNHTNEKSDVAISDWFTFKVNVQFLTVYIS